MQVASFLHTYIWSYLHPTPSKRPDAIKLGVLVEKAELDPVTSKSSIYILCLSTAVRHFRLSRAILKKPAITISTNSPTTGHALSRMDTILSHTVIYPSKTHPAIILHGLSLAQSPSKQHTKHANHFVRTYTSHDTLLDDPTITAVYICAPIGARYTLAKAALAKGKHVLCESPVAGNAEDVRDVHDFAREGALVLLDGVSLDNPLLRGVYPILSPKGWGVVGAEQG